ncbi:hypothetical protein PENDEC_c002G00372 [Penicillium decumbens]|uniref:Cytochrome b5 heme-binding domain-containing protein n=1 Tax=Penicillium decumbens TaxID=69771 RepID=A0A1V6PLT7_PENDC|nr:hypothetical protein PENDEC_c002G00372 [Penicillium decumbens]
MGWIGVGILVATAAYFLYRCPPRSWIPDHPSPQPDVRAEARPASTSEPEPARHDAPSTPPLIGIEEEDSPTTPKASASSAPPPVLAVPVLNLEGEPDTNDGRSAATQPPAQLNMNGSTKQQPAGRNDQTSKTESSPSLTHSSLPQAQKPPLLSAPSANTSSLMPPPSVPRLRPTPQPNRGPPGSLQPPRSNSSSLMPPPSAAAGLRVPSSGGLSSSTLAPSLKKPSSRKVVLAPGYSPLDWAALAANPKNQLRGTGLPPGLVRVTPSMLKTQNGRKGRDAWTSYQGRVYNIQPYVPYHPGGKGELLRGAGKDSAQLFQEVHPWVNWDGILSECLVGILVSENDIQTEDVLDAMD